jgi:CheY-like chemotaxis protein
MALITTRKSIRVLVVEDNPADVVLLREALRDAGIRHELTVVDDGTRALDYLHRRAEYSDAPTPDLVLLDINLPTMSGHDVLRHIKDHEQLCCLPVIVLSSSSSPGDVQQVYRNRGNCYIRKPASLEELFQIARVIKSFWLEVAVLPDGCGYSR